MEATIGVLWGYIIMENKMEATVGILWNYIIVENKMETYIDTFFCAEDDKTKSFQNELEKWL